MKCRRIVNQMFALLVVSIFAVGCSDSDGLSTKEQYLMDVESIQDYIESEGLDAYNVDSTGIYMAITEEGIVDTDSYPDLTAMITCSYKGYLIDGSVFGDTGSDSTVTFKLGDAVVGLQVAVAKLTIGDKATILIPSVYGNGSYSTSDIPANSVLIFDIELISFDSQSNIDHVIIEDYIAENGLDAYNVDSTGIYIAITEEGTKDVSTFPSANSTVTCSYEGYFTNGTVFDQSSSSTFSLQQVIEGWQIAFQELSVGDKATILIPSEYGYGAYTYGSIPGNSVLIFDVELFDFVY